MVLEPANIRSLLIRAWRERWSDIQWGIHIKTVLPRYISGDIYQLSDCLLQQALMGSLPNNLILSYLRHSLASQIVSYGGVIESISKYDGLNKPHCIHALLNLMHSMMKTVSCRGKPEDCLMLASSLIAGVKWLIQVIIFTTEKLIDLQTAPEHSSNIQLAQLILQEMLDSPFLMCMLQIGEREDQNIWEELTKKISSLETQLNTSPATAVENKDLLLKTVCDIRDVRPLSSIYGQIKYDSGRNPFCHAVHAVITLEVINHSTRDTKMITQQLMLLQKFKGLLLSELYLEILRTCFIGLGSQEYQLYQELKWVGFTYIKVPTILQSIHKTVHGKDGGSDGFSEELLEAVKRLSGMVTLLDVADCRVNCNCLEYLLKELIPRTPAQTQSNVTPSVSLLSERDAQLVLSNRLQESNFLKKLQSDESQGARPGSPDLVLRAQPTVSSILKTLSNKASDSVLPVMSLLISAKSRELLLIAAASSGNMHIYAQKFVKLNEQCKEAPPGETAKASVNRAFVFDISFLLLCHIAQTYGTEVVVSENCDTFIEQWIQDNIPESGKVKIPIPPSEIPDVAVIEGFLGQINSLETDTKYVQAKWNEMCRLASLSMREVIGAAYQGQLLKQMIFDLLSKFFHHLCCLPICVAAWLCSHIQQVGSSEAALSLEFLQYMQTTMLSREMTSIPLDVFKDRQGEVLKDRSNLMSEIIDNMVHVMKGPANDLSMCENNLVVSPDGDPMTLSNLLKDVWDNIKLSSGLLTHKAFCISHDLLRLGGTKWFVSNYVKAALERVFEDELQSSIDVVYGIFHLDIIGCTLYHIVYTVPSYLKGQYAADLMCEPRTSALARLTALLLVSCWVAVQPENPVVTPDGSPPSNSSNSSVAVAPPLSRGVKRTFSQREMEDMQDIFNQQNDTPINISSLSLGAEGMVFVTAMLDMFKLMNKVTKEGTLSPVTHLIVYTLQEIISMPHSSTLITLIPQTLLSNLVPMLPKPISFSYPQLLALTAPEPMEEESLIFPTDLSFHANSKDKDRSQAAAKILCVMRYFDLNAL